MTMSDVLYRTLHPWEFYGATLPDKVALWTASQKEAWEDRSARLFDAFELHVAVCDAMAEAYVRAHHAGEEEPSWDIDILEQLTPTIQQMADTGDLSLWQGAQDVIHQLTPEDKALLARVMQQLFPEKGQALMSLQDQG